MRRPAALVALLAAIAVLVAAAPTQPRPAAALPVGQSASSDYATEELGDPWDFSNQEDWTPLARITSPDLVDAAITDGVLRFTARPGGGVEIGASAFVVPGVSSSPDSLPWGRDSALHPIDTAVYRTVAMRLYSPAADTGTFSWFTCTQILPACQHVRFISLAAGWNVVTVDVGADAGWSGFVYSMRLVPSGVAQRTYDLDWLRVVRPGGSITPVDEPVPEVLDPSRHGGVDYAAAVRRDAWDFDQPSDVADTRNLTDTGTGFGLFHACNTNNDPIVYLPLAAPIDGNAFNRMRILIRYDGGFGLSGDPGGGMDLRVYWTVAGSEHWQPSEDVVVYPGWNDIDLDLSVPDVNEAGDPQATGWAGQTITGLRIDPHEDPGRRCFDLADVQLRSANVAFGGTTIRFRDNAGGPGVTRPGTTADVFFGTSPLRFDGPQVAAGLPVSNGENTFTWNGRGVPAGTYWVWVRLTDPQGHVSSAHATGQLVTFGPPRLAPGTVTGVATGSAGAPAVLANLTMTDAAEPGYITADRCSALRAGAFSNGNYTPGSDIANLAVVPVDPDGRLCLYNERGVHLIADTQGQFSTNGALAYTPATPSRVLDTRGAVKPGDGSVTRVVTGAPRGTQAALVNLTMTEANAAGYLSADRCSALTPGAFSNGNYAPGRNIANLSVVPLDADGSFCVYAFRATHLVVDVQGWFSSGGSTGLEVTQPTRRLDTRTGAKPGDGSVTRVQTGAAGATAALVNLTMTEATAAGYLTADRCSALRPGAFSNGNYTPGRNIANLAVVPLDPDGSFCVFAERSVHLVVDTQGVFDAGGLRFDATAPTRRLDTRQ